MTYKNLLFKSLSQVNNQQSPPCCWTCWKAEFSSLACALPLPLSICLSLFSPVPPRCWFNGKEVSLFILDNYLSGNPLKQFAVALFCGERNDLSGWYLRSQRDKKTTRELAVRSTPPLYLHFFYLFFFSDVSQPQCFWLERGLWEESDWRNMEYAVFFRGHL